MTQLSPGDHYTRAEDVPRLTAAWIEEFMGVGHRALAEYAAEQRHAAHDAKCRIEELQAEVDSLSAAKDWRDDLRQAQQQIANAIDELRSWQHSDDIEDVRHSVNMAIRALESV